MDDFHIVEERPDESLVVVLLERHLEFTRSQSPPEDVHALDIDGLLASDIEFFALRSGTELLGVGALKRLDDDHGELKSIHTTEAARGMGVGKAMVEHLVARATDRGMSRVSLETGTMQGFAPSRALYRATGFAECEPFGDYWVSEHSVCMTQRLSP